MSIGSSSSPPVVSCDCSTLFSRHKQGQGTRTVVTDSTELSEMVEITRETIITKRSLIFNKYSSMFTTAQIQNDSNDTN